MTPPFRARDLRVLAGATAAAIALYVGLLFFGLSPGAAFLVVMAAILLPLLAACLLQLLLWRVGRRLGVKVGLRYDGFVLDPPIQSAHVRLAAERALGPLRPLAALVRCLS
jgi:hypothetical protein